MTEYIARMGKVEGKATVGVRRTKWVLRLRMVVLPLGDMVLGPDE